MGLPLHRTRRRGSCYTEQAFIPLRFMQGQFLCQVSRDAQFFRKALIEKGQRPHGSAEGTAPCARPRAQGLPGASRLAPSAGVMT